jgi:hypothetical protein
MTDSNEVKVVKEWTDENGKKRRTVIETRFAPGPGTMSPHTAVMNLENTLEAQADDDGDVFGFSTDPLIVELFEHKLDQLKFAIEPEGKPKLGPDGQPLALDIPEGLEYLMDDHRGPVGRCTVWRARLLAIGDEEGARAISIAIQECIDQAKRIPAWTDIRGAVNLAEWTLLNGVYKYTVRFDTKLVPDGVFPMDLIKDWVDSRLIAAGCFRIQYNDDGTQTVKAKDPCWWRVPGKRVDIENWELPMLDDEVENLVHYAARCTHARWMEFRTQFDIPETGEVPMSMLLPLVCETKGIDVQINNVITEQAYTRLRARIGLTAYNSKLGTILQGKKSSDDFPGGDNETNEDFKERQRAIFTAQCELERTISEGFQNGTITINDIVTLWFHECNGGAGKINNAFRVVCFDGSPVLKALGISQPTKCQFLARGELNRLEWLVEKAREATDPFERMKELILSSKRHHEGFTDQNGVVIEEPVRNESGIAIHFHQCPDCLAIAQDALVRDLRFSKDSRESEFLKDLHGRIKALTS